MKIYDSVSEAYKKPKLIRIRENLFVLSFQVMKLLPAIYMLKKAMKEQSINERSVVVETSSGSFAYGIALACTELKLKFKIVSDNQMDLLLKGQLLNQSGEVLIVEKPSEKGGIQQARLNKLYELIDREPLSYWTCQYDNPLNPEAYLELGREVVEALKEDLILVGPVGSGGSTCGMISAIRERKNQAALVGVDTFNSILFGQNDGPRILPGLGNSILPKNLIHNKFDQVHWVTANEAFAATLQLHQKLGLYCGPTTGAAFPVARWLAEKNPKRNVVFISPDTGHRYGNTVYNPGYLAQNGFDLSKAATSPKEVKNPKEAAGSWSYMDWNQRELADVVKG